MWCDITGRFYHTSGGWWPCEIRALHSMIEDGYTIREMAIVLDRNYYGVAARMKKESLHVV